MEPIKLTNQEATMIQGSTWKGTISPRRYLVSGLVSMSMVIQDLYPKFKDSEVLNVVGVGVERS